jgi:hypothetical protein
MMAGAARARLERDAMGRASARGPLLPSGTRMKKPAPPALSSSRPRASALALSALSSLSLVVACGGSATPADGAPAPSTSASAATSAEPSSAPSAEAPKDEPLTALPSECAEKVGAKGGAQACLPPMKLTKKLCATSSLWVAFAMFQKGTPWTRAYLAARSAEAYNAYNGPTSDKLELDEELLILHVKAADAGGIQVSGAGARYDVLRWDGTCATLSDEEIRLVAPPKPKTARIAWKDVDGELKDAMTSDEGMAKLVKKRRDECKGATIGTVSKECEKADVALAARIVSWVRDGKVPPPKKLP